MSNGQWPFSKNLPLPPAFTRRHVLPARPMKKLLLLFLLVLAPLPAFAWNKMGHYVTAAIAYRELPARAAKAYAELLHAHPSFATWKADYVKEGKDVSFDAYLFMRASVWPDEIRGREHPDHAHNHSAWHYVDYPVTPPDFPMKGRPSPDNDVLFGIAHSVEMLASEGASKADRAVALAWLLHLGGDVHQPLHSAALTNETYPKGDRGGNDFYVRPEEQPVRLHALWDGLLGRADRPREADQVAIALRSRIAREALPAVEVSDPTAWSLEGREAAIEHVYLRGTLAGSLEKEEAPGLPEGYLPAAKELAEQRITLAGYRLADVLQLLRA